MHGFGIFWYNNGDRYRGEWSGGLFHGEGVYYTASSSGYFNGTWDQGNKVQGTWVRDKNLYYGPFANNVFHGKGIYIFPKGNCKEAMFQGGQMDPKSAKQVDFTPSWKVPEDFYTVTPVLVEILPPSLRNPSPLKPPQFPDGIELVRGQVKATSPKPQEQPKPQSPQQNQPRAVQTSPQPQAQPQARAFQAPPQEQPKPKTQSFQPEPQSPKAPVQQTQQKAPAPSEVPESQKTHPQVIQRTTEIESKPQPTKVPSPAPPGPGPRGPNTVAAPPPPPVSSTGKGAAGAPPPPPPPSSGGPPPPPPPGGRGGPPPPPPPPGGRGAPPPPAPPSGNARVPAPRGGGGAPIERTKAVVAPPPEAGDRSDLFSAIQAFNMKKLKPAQTIDKSGPSIEKNNNSESTPGKAPGRAPAGRGGGLMGELGAAISKRPNY
eukprot:TRINITY_DN2814_c0_g1_i1.p1 TRINITY_DN2814_c0_g1~~TRINITY_DN2814_c0_g1_i1.p1  ORF type:complete len:507 (+),score=162.22 TRINITY_DN2814_c0_g1_i1:230-1522(+)